MKKILMFLVLIIGFMSFSFGSNANTDISIQIQKLINEVKLAPPSERYKKMNQLKLLIRKLKAEERIKIMKKLHQQLHTSKGAGFHQYMNRHNHREPFTHKEHMEMRNMREQHRDNFKQEMHNESRMENPHGGENGRWGDRNKGDKNKGEHNRPWNHFR